MLKYCSWINRLECDAIRSALQTSFLLKNNYLSYIYFLYLTALHQLALLSRALKEQQLEKPQQKPECQVIGFPQCNAELSTPEQSEICSLLLCRKLVQKYLMPSVYSVVLRYGDFRSCYRWCLLTDLGRPCRHQEVYYFFSGKESRKFS